MGWKFLYLFCPSINFDHVSLLLAPFAIVAANVSNLNDRRGKTIRTLKNSKKNESESEKEAIDFGGMKWYDDDVANSIFFD